MYLIVRCHSVFLLSDEFYSVLYNNNDDNQTKRAEKVVFWLTEFNRLVITVYQIIWIWKMKLNKYIKDNKEEFIIEILKAQ